MSPAIARTLFGSFLALGAVDLAWLNWNAPRMAAARAASPPPSDDPPVQAAAQPAAIVATPPSPVAATAALPSLQAEPPPRAAPSLDPPAASPEPLPPLEAVLASCTVQFDRSRSHLRGEETARLAAIAETMKKHPRDIVRIEGHADRVAWKGNRGDNLSLSDDRASNVVRALIRLGVAPDRIRRAAFGDTKPLDDRASEEAYRRNRRVEVRVEPRGDR